MPREHDGAEPESLGSRLIKDKIIHTLKIFPKLSYSHLQVSIGTGLSPSLWHPELDQLLADGIVEKKQITATTPTGRDQVYTIISLSQPNSM